MTTRVRRPGPGAPSRTRALATLLGLLSVATLTAVAGPARADNMDPTPERFVTQPLLNGQSLPHGLTCQSIAANPNGALKLLPKGTDLNNLACQANNLPFQNLVSELGFAIAPTAFHPGRTTGFGGFQFGFEASYTKINQDAVAGGVQYWHLGTQGSVDPNTGLQSQQNTSPDSVLQVYSLKARKGFPFGFELVGDVSYIANTVMWTAGADIRWALMEGFRTGWPSYLPDVSVGGGVRTLTGTSKFSLTTVGIDTQISKPITLADTSVITPYVGYQRLQIFGDSSTVSLTPNVDPLKQCGYVGNMSNGEPICANKVGGVANSGDFNDQTTFASVRTGRNRGIIGMNYRYEVLYLAGQFLFDLTSPDSENPGLTPTRQWTTSLEAGVYF
jgi:hypothetical protein